VKISLRAYSRLCAEFPALDNTMVDLPDGATVADLLARLFREHPALEKWDAHLLVAVGLEWAARSQTLREGDEVSLMPPVQGG
jgi:molybdopterin converting factor small subunit